MKRHSTLSAACALAVLGLLSTATRAVGQSPGPTGTVTLPVGDYDKLRDRASHPPALPAAAPIASAVARADLVLRVGADAVRGTITFQGEVWRDGVVKVPLLRGGTITEGPTGATSVPLVSQGGAVSALVRGAAPFSIALSWAADLTSEPGRAVAVLPAIQAGSVQATLDLPGENADVRVEHGLLNSRAASAGHTAVVVTLEPGVSARVSWSSRESAARPAREVRLVSDLRSLVTIGESDVRVGALFDVTVTQGEPEALVVALPAGFEVASVSGASIESEGVRDRRLRLAVRESGRRHQFLVVLERPATGAGVHEEFALPALEGIQRETGEVAFEAVGTVELDAKEAGPLHRLDVAEVGDSVAALSRAPLLAAFRFQRRDAERVPLAFDVTRFADAPVLAAAAERADATTLVTAEGRTLTEVSLVVRNRGQLFLKVGLPQGGSIVSADVAGQPVKPVEGTDGARVPLVRPGFQPSGAYTVSFVYVTAGEPFAKKGQAALSLPRMDVPVSAVYWELFVPDRYEVRRVEGDAFPRDLVPEFPVPGSPVLAPAGVVPESGLAAGRIGPVTDADANVFALGSSDFGGVCVDPAGAVLPGVSVTLTQSGASRAVITNARGAYLFRNAQPGEADLVAALEGFRTARTRVRSGRAARVTMDVGGMAETVTVTSEAPAFEPQKAAPLVQSQAASQNVSNLQRRASGVLPVRIDVPRAGRSYVLVRPLVLDEPTTARIEYRTK